MARCHGSTRLAREGGGGRRLAIREGRALMAQDEPRMSDRQRAEEEVRGIVEKLDRPTLALLYRTLHDALGFRLDSVDIEIKRLGG